MAENYAALMIDLKKSRDYKSNTRVDIQKHLMQILRILNEIYAEDLVRKVAFSAGDEVQGLFRTPEAAYLYYRLFSFFLHPVQCRAGIGVGTWDVQIENQGSTVQDGQAYHRARFAISCADDGEGYPVLFCSGDPSDCIINTIISRNA